VIIPAHDEEGVIGARLDNLLALDYPPEQLEIVVVSDGSTDGTDEIVAGYGAREPRVRLLALPRGGKLAALNHAVGESTRDVVAFSDANSRWAPDALRKLVRNLADDDVAYVCGKLVLEGADGRTGRGSTGATSCGCARASPRSARSPAATARSTRCGARTTSLIASARTSASRTRW
jgi:cellulose synthase/poly-beta-1,6-N-acetylglucosamine synthase-like glycosyltransferase